MNNTQMNNTKVKILSNRGRFLKSLISPKSSRVAHGVRPSSAGQIVYTGVMQQAITLPPEDLAALARICREQGVSRDDAVESAVRWYIEREGDLPTIDFGDDPD